MSCRFSMLLAFAALTQTVVLAVVINTHTHTNRSGSTTRTASSTMVAKKYVWEVLSQVSYEDNSVVRTADTPASATTRDYHAYPVCNGQTEKLGLQQCSYFNLAAPSAASSYYVTVVPENVKYQVTGKFRGTWSKNGNGPDTTSNGLDQPVWLSNLTQYYVDASLVENSYLDYYSNKYEETFTYTVDTTAETGTGKPVYLFWRMYVNRERLPGCVEKICDSASKAIIPQEWLPTVTDVTAGASSEERTIPAASLDVVRRQSLLFQTALTPVIEAKQDEMSLFNAQFCSNPDEEPSLSSTTSVTGTTTAKMITFPNPVSMYMEAAIDKDFEGARFAGTFTRCATSGKSAGCLGDSVMYIDFDMIANKQTHTDSAVTFAELGGWGANYVFYVFNHDTDLTGYNLSDATAVMRFDRFNDGTDRQLVMRVIDQSCYMASGCEGQAKIFNDSPQGTNAYVSNAALREIYGDAVPTISYCQTGSCTTS